MLVYNIIHTTLDVYHIIRAKWYIAIS